MQEDNGQVESPKVLLRRYARVSEKPRTAFNNRIDTLPCGNGTDQCE